MKHFLRETVVALGVVVCMPVIAAAQLCTVGVDHGTIQASLNDAMCLEIDVPAGTYYEHLTITRDVAIRGAGATATFLDGGAPALGRMITVTGDGITARIENITIRNGLLPDRARPGPHGAGMFVGELAGASLHRVVVRDNRASGGNGGGIMVDGGRLSVEWSTVTANTAARGGGIYTTNGATVSIVSSMIGGVTDADGNEASQFSGTGDGGGLYAAGGSQVFINNSQFMHNRAIGPASRGGAILTDSSAGPTFVLLEDSGIVSNQAGEGGGIAWRGARGGITSLNRSLLAGNRAIEGGGGGVLWGNANSLTIGDSTLSGNSAITGGAAVAWSSETGRAAVSLESATITANFTMAGGAGISGVSSSVFTIVNTIVSGNMANVGSTPIPSDCDVPSLQSFGNNIFGQNGLALGCPAGPGDIVPAGSVDTVISPILADNGGQTLTHLPVDEGPAVDAGSSLSSGTDQRGVPRGFNRRNDIGAVELLFNRTPSAGASDYVVNEGDNTTLSADVSSDEDEDAAALTSQWDLDGDGTFETNGASVAFSAVSIDGPNSALVNVRVCDNGQIGGFVGAPYAEVGMQVPECNDYMVFIEVLNVAPVVNAGPDEANTPGATAVSASFSDAGIDDTHTATIDWGDGSAVEAVPVTESGGSGTIAATHQYPTPRVFTIMVCVVDDDGDSACDSLVNTVAIPTPPTPPGNSAGAVFGGVRTANGGRAGFVVWSNGKRMIGVLDFQRNSTRFLALRITSFKVGADGRSATFSGIGVNGQMFEAYIQNNGWAGLRDVFRLTIGGVLKTDGVIASGNVEIRR